jgi:hypothetical protein
MLIPPNTTQVFFKNHDVPLRVFYMFQLFLRPSAGMSIQTFYTGRYYNTKSKGPLVNNGIILTGNSNMNGSNATVLTTKQTKLSYTMWC